MLDWVTRRWRRAKPETLDVRTGFAKWASQYPPRAHNALMQAEEDVMLRLMPDPKGKECLDLACGTGRYMLLAQHRDARAVAGTDLSFEMLRHGLGKTPGLRVCQSHFYELPYRDETFDLVICGLSVAYVDDLCRVLREASRVLRPHGAIVYSDRHPSRAADGVPRFSWTENGRNYVLEHRIHLLSDHRTACREAGLSMSRIVEEPLILAILAVKSGG